MRYKNIYLLLVALFLASMLIFGGCKTTTPTVIEKEKIVYVHSDSVRYIDSTVVIPIEVYKDYTGLLDTLYLKTSISESWSVVDTNQMLLVGELKNKNAIKYQVKYVEKVVTNDSIVEREVPVPFEVEVVKTKYPWWAWICLTWTIITILSIAWAIYRMFKRIG